MVDYQVFGTTGNLLPQYNLGRTTTHEVGHWLGLRHIWGDDSGACTQSDGISDTPNQGDDYGGQCPTGTRSSCGSNDMYMNYMDYTDDACMNMLTNGQKAVMRATLNSGGWRQNFDYFLPTIAGTGPVCTSNRDFTLQDVPVGATVNWSISPTNLVNASSGTGTTATFRAASSASNGWITLTFNIIGGAGCGIAVITRNIWIGTFTTSQVTVSGTTGVCPGNLYNYTANVPGGHANNYTYNWTFPPGWTVNFQSANTISLYVPLYNTQYGTVRVSVNNTCGTTPYTGVTVFPAYSCGSYLTAGEFSIYPNPADEHITVEQIMEGSSVQADTTEATFTEIRLNTPASLEGFSVEMYDQIQKVVAQGTSKGTKIQLDTSSLPSGTYFLHIRHKEAVLQKQIVIE